MHKVPSLISSPFPYFFIYIFPSLPVLILLILFPFSLCLISLLPMFPFPSLLPFPIHPFLSLPHFSFSYLISSNLYSILYGLISSFHPLPKLPSPSTYTVLTYFFLPYHTFYLLLLPFLSNLEISSLMPPPCPCFRPFFTVLLFLFEFFYSPFPSLLFLPFSQAFF